MFDFLDGAVDTVKSAVSSVVAEVMPSAAPEPAPAPEPAASAPAPEAQAEAPAAGPDAAPAAGPDAAPAAPPAEAAAPAAAPAPAPVATATDEHHDWISSVFGVDPRASVANFFGGGDADADAAAPPSSGGASAGAGGGDPAMDGAGGAGGAPASSPAPAEEGDGAWDDVLHVIGMGKRAEREDRVAAAATKLRGMKEEDIQKLSTDDRLKLLADLQANGELKGNDRGMLNRVYNNTPIDPAQQAVDDARSSAIAKEVAADPELQKAQANWASLSDDEKAAALKKVIAAQSKAMGVDAPEIVVEHGMQEGGMPVDGVYEADGKLHLNMDKDRMTGNFPQAVSIAAHENTHHYQEELVKRLEAGTLHPGDPEYDQARLFAANNAKGGYIAPAEGAKTEDEQRESVRNYKAQPVERHAWNNGSVTAKKIDTSLKTARGVVDPMPMDQ